jgi:hypothetical protein
MKTACRLLPLLLTLPLGNVHGMKNVPTDSRGDEIRKRRVRESQGGHSSADERLRNVLDHPAFAGFARLLLMWDARPYDETLRPKDIGSLLPHHSQVDPKTVVSALNRMIDAVNKGHGVFDP